MKKAPSQTFIDTPSAFPQLFDPTGLTETQLSNTPIFQGQLLNLQCDLIQLPDGTEAVREYTINADAVMVIPVLANGNLVMERQFRYPLQRVFLEFPAGKMSPLESPEDAAQRELTEETGYFPEQLEHWGVIHPAISYSTEAIHLFLAKKLTQRTQQLDKGEFLEIVELSPQDAWQLLDAGCITDAKTMIGLLLLKKHLHP